MNDQTPWIRQPRQPAPHIKYAHSLGRGMLTFEQITELVKAINQLYVAQKNKMSYLSQHQARAEMNRIFGYGNWDSKVASMRCDYEERIGDNTDPRWPKDFRTKQPKVSGSGAYWVVGYEGSVHVAIRDLWGMPVAEYLEFHFEESAPQPNRGEARALALTSVESYALRRSLINLGDRFGLGLYNGGSVAPHGQYTIQLEPGILFDWKPVDAQGQQPATAPVPRQPSHETIAAEPAVPEGWAEQAAVGALEAPEPTPGTADAAVAQMGLQSPPVTRPPVAQRFPQAREQVQQMNQEARAQAGGGYPAPPQQQGGPAPSIAPGATDALRARMQGAFKVDAEDERERYERENDYANEQAMQQHRGGVVE
jgi:hypothetical protein